MKIKSILVIAVLAVVILGVGFTASAQSTDIQALINQLRAQIQVLLQQIAQLQSQQGQTQPWCHTFTNYLVAGSTGSEVQNLQTALYKEGLLSTDDTMGDNGPTMNPNYQNIFSENTAAAVVAFQAKYGIRQTGTVGPLTRAKLNSLYGCGIGITPTPVPTPIPTPTCTPKWICGWGPCTNGYQSQIPTDLNNCGTSNSASWDIACPALARQCNQCTSDANCPQLGVPCSQTYCPVNKCINGTCSIINTNPTPMSGGGTSQSVQSLPVPRQSSIIDNPNGVCGPCGSDCIDNAQAASCPAPVGNFSCQRVDNVCTKI